MANRDGDLELAALRHALASQPITSEDLRQTLGDETLVSRLTDDVTAYALLDVIADLIECEPACFAPDDPIATPERHSYPVWQQRPARGVVADIYGWTVLLTRGTYRPTDIGEACERCDGTGGIVATALDILGFSWDEDEEALDVLSGSSWGTNVRERAAEGVERIHRFQTVHEARLRERYIAYDAAQRAVEDRTFATPRSKS